MTIPLQLPPSMPLEERHRLERDFDTYRRELSRLLAEGHANRYALIRDGQVVSVWDTAGDAMQAAYQLFGDAPVAINKINPLDVRRFAIL